MLTLKAATADYGIKIPQSYSEVTSEILSSYVKNVHLAKYYCIIAICRKTRLFDLAMLDNKVNRPIISSKTFLVKFGEDFKENFSNAEIKDTVLINRSSLELGTQLNTACPLSEEKIAGYLRNKKFGDELLRTAMQGKLVGDNGNDEVVLVSYKIVTNSSITALVPDSAKEENVLLVK